MRMHHEFYISYCWCGKFFCQIDRFIIGLDPVTAFYKQYLFLIHFRPFIYLFSLIEFFCFFILQFLFCLQFIVISI